MNQKVNSEYTNLSKISKLLLTFRIREKVKHVQVRELREYCEIFGILVSSHRELVQSIYILLESVETVMISYN